MTISLGGLASGIDTTSLIDGLMSYARLPSNQLATKKAQVDAASQTVSGFSTKLAALKTAALALSTSSGFASFSATSSDTGVVAVATGAANVGTYDVVVNALAKNQKTRSDSVASATTPLGFAGTLTLQPAAGGAASAVTIAATDDLTAIAAKISASGARVSASVLSEGSTQRLVLQGLDTGSTSGFSIAENGFSLGLATPANTYQTASDASLTVDGLPVTSKTNQITDVIPGVKLALVKPTTGTATLQVASDPTALRQKMSALVTAYNDVVNTAHAATGFGTTKASNSVLAADSSMRGALRKIARVITSPVAGATGRYTTLGSVGLATKTDGTLSFDATKLDAALTADPSSVAKLFVKDPALGASGAMSVLMSAVDGLVMGNSSPIQARADSLSSQSRRIATTKTKMDARLADYEQQLKRQFTDMDQAVGRYQSMSTSLSGWSNSGSNQ
jgi:flagellar hook-associated protein 2